MNSITVLFSVFGLITAGEAFAEEQPSPSVDSRPQAGAPHGRIFEFTFDHSTVYPGTTRRIKVYVPAQYRADKPACVYVGLDDLSFGAPVVFDNLIASGEMPITIAVGVPPGVVESGSPDRRFNRSLEFDGLGDQLARFLLDEIFPEIERRQTPDGLPIRLSTDPNDRAAGGASTGGIGSFTLAWERPDAFRRVFTAIGTFVGMRGGDGYAVLVRKTEPKPIRVFIQDGSRDEWAGSPEMGDWWLGNLAMNSALVFAGYQVEHAWTEGGHSSEDATAMFPAAMRWLWRGWPQPVATGESHNVFLKDIRLPAESWEVAGADDPVTRQLTVNARKHRVSGSDGRVYEADALSGEVRISGPQGKSTLIDSGLKAPTGIALSPDGQWLAVAESRTHWGYSYRIQTDGSVRDKQRFYWFHVPDGADDSGVGNWVVDRDGRLYAATRLGIQVFDHNGRVRALLPIPGGAARDVRFGGPQLQYLYVVAADGTTHRRKMQVPGIAPGAAPSPIPDWGPP